MFIFIIGCAEKAEIVPEPEILPFKPKDIGEIEGLVYETDGKTPISGVMVLAYDRYGYTASYAQTDMHGRYTIRHLPVGEYLLQIRSGELYGTAQKYAGEYYKNAYNWKEAGVISVKRNAPTSSIHFLLEKGGALRGKLIDASQKEPLANTPLFLRAYNSKNSYVTYLSYTDSLGEYLVTGIEPGNYKIKIEPEGWVGGFYDGDSWDSALVVESKLDTVTLADFEAILGGVISGEVKLTDSEYPNPSGLMIQVIGGNKSLQKEVDSTGHYVISGLPACQYIVKLSPPKGSPYAWEYYPTAVKVTPIDTSPGIDFELKEGGVISGTVKDEAGLPIEEFDIDVYSVAPEVVAKQSLPLLSGGEICFSGGEYEIRGLPEGEYILKISSFNPRIRQSYVEGEGANTRVRPYTPIKVRGGYNTSGINFTLKKAGWVEGFMLLNNELLSGDDIKFKIIAFNVNTGEVSEAQNTFCGGYRISGLEAGEYKLCAFSPNSEFASLWIGGGRKFDDPKSSVVKIEEGISTNVDFSVILGGCKISGKVYDAETYSNVSGKVIVYDPTGHIVQLAESNEAGYKLQGLEAGKYFIRTYTNYQDKWYVKGKEVLPQGDTPSPLRTLLPQEDRTGIEDTDTAPYVIKIPPPACEVEVKGDTLLTGIDFELYPVRNSFLNGIYPIK